MKPYGFELGWFVWYKTTKYWYFYSKDKLYRKPRNAKIRKTTKIIQKKKYRQYLKNET